MARKVKLLDQVVTPIDAGVGSDMNILAVYYRGVSAEHGITGGQECVTKAHRTVGPGLPAIWTAMVERGRQISQQGSIKRCAITRQRPRRFRSYKFSSLMLGHISEIGEGCGVSSCSPAIRMVHV